MKVHEYFSGKSVFVTGGTGFIGKALIEKLLRSCPDLENIYVLVRPKRGLSAQERLKNLTENLLFEPLKKSHPSALSKLVAIEGDIVKLKLGISETDRRLLAEKVNFIYHTAASVRLYELLRDSVFINVRSTREIIELAYGLKNLSTFVYVSTTYCNVDKAVVEEKVYPAHGDWKEAISSAEGLDQTALEIMTAKYIEPMPNTYTYTKRLSECLVVDMCKGRIPAVILRPSIVMAALYDPAPGWNDSLNGVFSIVVAAGKGVLRTMYGEPDVILDCIPVDVVNTILIAATAESCKTKNIDEVKVYNCSKYKKCPVTLNEVVQMWHGLFDDVPFNKALWYPRISLTSCWCNYYIQILLFHLIPAIFLDTALWLARRKPMLVKMQRKIYTSILILYPFLKSTWGFINDNVYQVLENFPPEGMGDFDRVRHSDVAKEQLYEYLKQATMGVDLWLFNEKFDKDVNRKVMRRRWMMDVAVRSIILLTAFWYFFTRINLIKILFNFCVSTYVDACTK